MLTRRVFYQYILSSLLYILSPLLFLLLPRHSFHQIATEYSDSTAGYHGATVFIESIQLPGPPFARFEQVTNFNTKVAYEWDVGRAYILHVQISQPFSSTSALTSDFSLPSGQRHSVELQEVHGVLAANR